MDKASLDKLLVEALSDNPILRDNMLSLAVTKRLPTMSAYGTVQLDDADIFDRCLSVLREHGTVVQADESYQTLTATWGDGVLTNPAVMVVQIEGDTASIISAAKEGLIKQHTAEKAIASFVSYLK